MAYEFHNEQNYYSDDDQSTCSGSQLTRGMKKALLKLHKEDKNFHQLNRRVTNSKTKKYELVGVFASGGVGMSIRNAITGVRNFEHKVGSANEDLYFSVLICNGETGSNPLTLFYDSPDEYERHQYTQVDRVTKRIWQQKNLDARRRVHPYDDYTINTTTTARDGRRVIIVR